MNRVNLDYRLRHSYSRSRYAIVDRQAPGYSHGSMPSLAEHVVIGATFFLVGGLVQSGRSMRRRAKSRQWHVFC